MSAFDNERWMGMALVLGRRNIGQTWPNPSVGCVVVKAGRVIGRGWTGVGGTPHAESVALERAGGLAKGATVYVTLEPCAHRAKTPPCVEALIAAGVARVVYALQDPDPRVAGKGAERLKKAGIDVNSGVLGAEAKADHAGFLSRITRARPFLTLKLATSLDGRIATETGESQWITGPEARRAVQGLRASHDGILVGAGTARADDPRLDVRAIKVRRQPMRIIVSGGLDLPEAGNLAAKAGDGLLCLVHGTSAEAKRKDAWQARGAELIEVGREKEGDGLDLTEMLHVLAQKGLTRILCEGGGVLAASLLKAGLVDQLVHFSAGKVLGGDGRAAIAPLALEALDAAPQFKSVKVSEIGKDVVHVWR